MYETQASPSCMMYDMIWYMIRLGLFCLLFCLLLIKFPSCNCGKSKHFLNILNLAHPRKDELKDYCRIKDNYIFSSNAEAEVENGKWKKWKNADSASEAWCWTIENKKKGKILRRGAGSQVTLLGTKFLPSFSISFQTQSLLRPRLSTIRCHIGVDYCTVYLDK